MMAVAQVSPMTYWYDTASDFLITWAVNVAAATNPPLVHSISYGAEEKYLSLSYCNVFNTEALKLLSMGITIVASSGDSGAMSASMSSTSQCAYSPQFPASSPYVTAVGATMGPESGNPEVVCQGDTGGTITSGGGFSSFYSKPSWQNSAVSHYFSQQTPVSGYATNGRGYPDVSLLGNSYVVVMGGQYYYECGTSASSPVFGGMVTLVNAARLKAGKKPVGWINPALYQYSGSFVNDITSGNNKCNVNGAVCCSQGYSAATGWDPATGLGSINFANFLSTFLSIGNNPAASKNPTAAPTMKVASKPTAKPTVKSSAKPTAKTSLRPPAKFD